MRSVTLLVAALVFAVGARAAHAVPAGTTLLVDRPAGLGGLPPDGANDARSQEPHAISTAGTYVVFSSTSDALLPPGVPTGPEHVFRRNVATGETELVDRAADGTVLPGYAGHPVISGDGAVVAFLANGPSTLYVKDLDTGALEEVASGAGRPALDADGSRVAFQTTAKLDAVHDTNTDVDVYRHDVTTDTTVLISRADGAGDSSNNQGGRDPAIDAAGVRVAFSTGADWGGADDVNSVIDVYYGTGSVTKLVSALDGQAKSATAGASSAPSISADGTKIAFTSLAALEGTGSGQGDVFVRDLPSQETVNVSRPHLSVTTAADGPSDGAVISADGTRVGFRSKATNLVTGFAPAGPFSPLAYVRVLANHGTQLVSRDDGLSGAQTRRFVGSLSLDGDGQAAVFESFDALGGRTTHEAEVWIRDTAAGTTRLASAPTGAPLADALSDRAYGDVGRALSADGRLAVFASYADGLSAADDDDVHNVYVRDLATNALTLVSRPDALPGQGDSEEGAISADGSRVALTYSDGSTYVVYVCTLATGACEAASRAGGAGGAVALDAFSPVLSADGRRVAFVSELPLDPADTNTKDDVYVRDLDANTTTLVSRAPDGTVGDGGSDDPAISADGRRIAFASQAGNLGDYGADTNVWLRDLDAGTTTLVSRAAAPADGYSYDATISADGRRVAFVSQAANLGDGDTGSDEDVWVRDLAAGTTTLVSRTGADGPAADGSVGEPAISADGSTVAFTTSSPSLLPAGVAVDEIVVRDLAARSLVVASRADGPDGAPAAFDSYSASLSDDGGCVLFTSEGPGLEPGGYPSADYDHVHLRALADGCPVAAPVVTPSPSPSASPAGTPPPGPAGDRVAPRITKVKVTRRGIRFRLSEAARVKIVVRHGKRRRARRVAGRAGANRVRLRLRGRLRVSLRATDAAGNRSKLVRKRVRIRRR